MYLMDVERREEEFSRMAASKYQWGRCPRMAGANHFHEWQVRPTATGSTVSCSIGYSKLVFCKQLGDGRPDQSSSLNEENVKLDMFSRLKWIPIFGNRSATHDIICNVVTFHNFRSWVGAHSPFVNLASVSSNVMGSRVAYRVAQGKCRKRPAMIDTKKGQ